MAHEPCMTLKELANLKGVSINTLTNRSKKLPYPEPTVFAKNIGVVQANVHRRPAQYPRSSLLQWFEEVSKL